MNSFAGVTVRRWMAVGLLGCVFCSEAVAEEEAKTASQWLQSAADADAAGDWRTAERACNEAIALEAKLAAAHYYRGRARFCLSKFADAVEDFDRYVALRPAAASRQWERGIACYYAGQFTEGAKQFALYQTYHDNDVENSVWRYLCMAQDEKLGKRPQRLKQAREAILPIRNDRRQGMMKVYDLYRGEASVKELLAAVKPTEEQPSTGPLFYAQLYIGLYHEVQGDRKQAEKMIALAANEHHKDARQGRVNHFMYEVAAVHHQRFQRERKRRED